MKHLGSFLIALTLAVGLSSCASQVATFTSKPTWTNTSEPAFIPETPTSLPEVTRTATRALMSTLGPQEANEAIQALLRGTLECPLPCFWSIVPEHTRLEDAQAIFERLGMHLENTGTENGADFYAFLYETGSGLELSPLLKVKDGIVRNINIVVTPEKQQAGIAREWLVYSPETLISRYGEPSSVDFSVDRGGPSSLYAMRMYFDAENLIVEYSSHEIGGDVGMLQVCPLVNQINDVRVWMGKDPQYPPLRGVRLEDATTLTMEQFSKLMTGNPEKACMNLRAEAFP